MPDATQKAPTQAAPSRFGSRCRHGFLEELRICPHCFDMPEPRTREELTAYLAELAKERYPTRPREAGRFLPVALVGTGLYRCWCCGQILPLDSSHFRRAASKATGYQTRCKACDNRLHDQRRRRVAA